MEQVFYFDLNDRELCFFKKEIEDIIIRNKNHIMRLLVKIVKLILICPKKIKEGVGNKKGILQIFIKDRIKRAFYVSNFKTTSIYFPFDIDINEDEWSIKYLDIQVDFCKLACIERLVDDDSLWGNLIVTEDILDLLMTIEDILDEVLTDSSLQNKALKNDIIKLYFGLLILEDGYIRFDDDEENEKAGIHPRFHFDIFYTNGVTFKLGIPNKTTLSKFIDLLNLKTKCCYLLKLK